MKILLMPTNHNECISVLSPEKDINEGANEDWQNIYSRLAGNEIHSITAENSKFFQEYIGKTFTHASCMAHKK
jgi:mevalonate pyrophosphate decarboxylase